LFATVTLGLIAHDLPSMVGFGLCFAKTKGEEPHLDRVGYVCRIVLPPIGNKCR
jgi:hypothetical protein